MPQKLIKAKDELLKLKDVDPTELDDSRILKYRESTKSFIFTDNNGSGYGSANISCIACTVSSIPDLLTLNSASLSPYLDYQSSLHSGDFLLVKDQLNPIENGVYTISEDTGLLIRVVDLGIGKSLPAGSLVIVKEGNVYKDALFTLVSDNSLLIGTDPILWTLHSHFLHALKDVSITNLEGGEALVYSVYTNRWVNGKPALYLNDLIDVEADSQVGDRYLKFDPTTSIWRSILIDFVTSINGYEGDVTLTTNQVPETSARLYFNKSRFLGVAATVNLDSFQDVEYDQYIYDGNVLRYNSLTGKWVPRSPISDYTLNDLTDVVINYNADPPFYGEGVNFPILKPVWNPVTEEFEGQATDLIEYNRHWMLAWVDSDQEWKVYNVKSLIGRVFLSDLSDVDSSAYPVAPNHGQALMWDGDINRWRPGGFVELETTDNLLEGEVNLYLSTINLPVVANKSLHIGHLENVDDSLASMSVNSHPAAGLLAWDPAISKWKYIEALTEDVTTANVPESTGFMGMDPPVSITSPHQRVYFTVNRVKASLGNNYGGELEWFGNVYHTYGKYDGNVLCWDAIRGKWTASDVAIGIFDTDHLPQGRRRDREYYSDARVEEWADAVVKPSIDYFDNVVITNATDGQSLVWSINEEAWVNGYPLPLPINNLGDLLVGIGDNDFDYDRIPVGLDGQYLRVDFKSPNLVTWADQDQNFKAVTCYPDIPHHEFVRSKDSQDTIAYLGTEFGQVDMSLFTNPIPLNLINIYQESIGIPLSHLTDRVYFNIVSGQPQVGITDSNLAAFTDIASDNLIFDFGSESAYRPEALVFQSNVTGNFKFKVSLSKDGLSWTTLTVGNDLYQFELSIDMNYDGGIGENSEIIDEDTTLDYRKFYLVKLPFYGKSIPTGNSIDNAFFRFMRLEPIVLSSGSVNTYEIQIYGWYNNNIKYHILNARDRDSYLVSGINNLEILVPGITSDISTTDITPGFNCWIVSDLSHTTKIYTEGAGRIYNNITTDTPNVNGPILLPPKTVACLTYFGPDEELVDNNPAIAIQRWHLAIIGASSGGSSGGGTVDTDYALNRANHVGTQHYSTIVGLATVANTGSYNDLINRPNFKTVATTGAYSDLTGRPTLGTASSKDAGTLAGQVLLLYENNKLPPLDGSSLTGIAGTFSPPTTTKGDLIVHNGVTSARLPVSTNGYVLMCDSTEPTGVKWGTVSGAGTDATTLSGFNSSYYLNRANHYGTIPVGAVIGLAPVATSGNYNSLSNRPTFGSSAYKTAGLLADNVLLLTEDNKLPALDGSLLTNIGSPLSNIGDLIVRGPIGDIALPVGTQGQILSVDTSQPTKLKWITNATTDAQTLQGYSSTYYLNRANHTGTQPASTISGLSTVAITGNYDDLLNTPTINMAVVATTGQYSDLIGKPALGTAALYNVGTGPFNIIQLTPTGALPDVLKSQLTSPLSAKGDLYTFSTSSTRLSVGVDGQVLVSDSSAPTGLRWVTFPDSNNALTLNNQSPAYYLSRANHTGTQAHTTITGLGSAATKDAGLLANNVLLLSENNKLPAIDGSLLTGVQESLHVATVSSSTTLGRKSNQHILVNTSAGSVTITMPSSPTIGDRVLLSDFAGSNPLAPSGFGLYSLTVLPNTGQSLHGYSDIILDTENSYVGFIFTSSSWKIFTAQS